MQEFVRKHISFIAWSMAAAVSVIAIVAWGQNRNWQLDSLTSYQLFPLFGLLAFSLMWCHFIMGGIKAGFNIQDAKVDKNYFQVTAGVVLVALLIHPSLLIWQLFADGFGLPPKSYVENYIAPGMAWAVFIASISWLVFMAFEFRRYFSKKTWWKYVLYANAVAIWAVYIHSLKVGADVSSGWLHSVWIFYGVALAAAFIAKYGKKWFAKS